VNRQGAVRARLAELGRRFALPEAAPAQLARLLDVIVGDPHAPTTVTDRTVAVDAHVADALVGLEVDGLRTAGRIADLGAGAGFPGLVLAAALPHAAFTLVEANGRKCAFLELAIGAMDLENVAVVNDRVESWRAGAESQDVVTARALAPLNVLVEYAAPLLRGGGELVAWKGRRDEAEEADGAAAASKTGLELAEVRPVHPWDGAEHLHLHRYLKVGTTPNRFPRRPGMASKRPLRADA
jgi:16S rRNA (guanine527-N7)-methyltransferase